MVRDERLKAADDEYWRAVVAMEGPPGGGGGVWDDEEVQAAIARAMGDLHHQDGGDGLEKIGREARGFVDNVTKDLENR